MNKRTMILLLVGFLGGLAPSMITVARILQGGIGADEQPPSIWGYCAGALIYGIIGTIFVFAMGEKVEKKAFFLGIAAPSLIIASTQPIVSNRSNAESAFSEPFRLPLFASLRAGVLHDRVSGEDPASIRIQNRTVALRSLNNETHVLMNFLDEDHRPLGLSLSIPPASAANIAVPEGAVSVEFSVGGTASPRQMLSADQNSLTEFTIKTKSRLRYGVFSAFGQRPTEDIDFDVLNFTQLDPPLFDLLDKISHSDVAIRTSAVNKLALEEPFRSSAATNSAVLDLLEHDRIEGLSAQGVINAIIILARHDAASWTDNLFQRARSLIQGRRNGSLSDGERWALSELESSLSRIPMRKLN